MAEEIKKYLFRHKQIRRFTVAGFEFNDFELTIEGDEERERFIQIVGELPAREQVQIFEINKEAAAAAEVAVIQQVGSTAVRGPMTAADILTAKDRQRIAEQQAGQGGEPAKPVGINQGGFAALAASMKPKT